ncbi:calcium-binding protein [Pseudomonas aeruginosa]|uniref:calcium-binding protein n=1 Tax=Pseudomonas aeruginosa TaxID=287 RepID=UPI000D69A833|nr:M10 family metallopeptidase C-terminal domain-containing protein [Pseudomonas aeruginosa]MBI7310094.1 M10 family metallopeptidase C-terminal domain-containing protein [Pseudomonas aeruginosa]
MSTPNFDVSSSQFAIQELSYLNIAWGSYAQGETFSINGSGSYRLARIISDAGYDAAVVEKLDSAGQVTDAVYLNQGASGADLSEVLGIESGSSTQAEKAAQYYQEAAAGYDEFSLKLSGHSMGGGLANYTLARIIADGGEIPETYTFAAENATRLIDTVLGNSAELAGHTSNFITQNDYFFGTDAGFFLSGFLAKNVDGGGFTDQYVLPVWSDNGGNDSHTRVFLDIANPSGATAYDNLAVEIRGSSAGTTLLGNSAANILFGNQGDDILVGGGGADVLWGGEGRDSFRFNQLGDSTLASADSIRDFVSGQDKIDVSALVSEALSLQYVDAFSSQAGQVILSFDQASNAGSLAIDFSGDSQADFFVNVTGQAQASDIVA